MTAKTETTMARLIRLAREAANLVLASGEDPNVARALLVTASEVEARNTPERAGKRARGKGAAWQAALAQRWRDSGLYPDAASSQGAQTRSGRKLGKTPPDVDGTPWWVEAKHTRAANPVGALRQAERERKAADDERPAIAVVKPSGDKLVGPVVCMRLDTFETLIRAQREGWESP